MMLGEPREENPPLGRTGSSDEDEPVYLAVGRLGRPHGVRGELRMSVFTDFPERLRAGKKVYVGEEHIPQRIRSVREHQNELLVAFRGVEDRTEAGLLTNQWVYVLESELPALEEGEYYQHELLELEVFTEDGQRVGEVVEILETGANDVLVVLTEAQKEVLLPVIADVILEINLEEKRILARLLPGLVA